VRALCAAFALSASGLSSEIDAQQPPAPLPPPVQPAPALPAIQAYRPPQLALVQPLPGGAVPQDKPVPVFRFSQGELTDPVDATSFSLSVDGEDRTALFQVSAVGEVWGPIALVTPATKSDGGLVLGTHQILARICSSRGACATAQAPLLVLPANGPKANGQATAPPKPPNNKRRLIELLLSAGKNLLLP